MRETFIWFIEHISPDGDDYLSIDEATHVSVRTVMYGYMLTV